MARAFEVFGHSAQALGRVVFEVAFANRFIGDRVEKQITIFSDKEEQQAIDDAQELAIVVLSIETAVGQLVAEVAVGWVFEKAESKGGDGFFNAIAELIEGACALILGNLHPFFEPAVG